MSMLDKNGVQRFWAHILALANTKADKEDIVAIDLEGSIEGPTSTIDADTLDGHTFEEFITREEVEEKTLDRDEIVEMINERVSEIGSADMMKATYDANGNGIVDNAEKVNGHTVFTNVPANAKFTDESTRQWLVEGGGPYPILLSSAANGNSTTDYTLFDSRVKLDMSTNTISANVSGKAATAGSADKALKDEQGRKIVETYATIAKSIPRLGVNPLTTKIENSPEDTVANWVTVGTGIGVVGENDRALIVNCPASGWQAWIFNLVYNSSAVYQLYMPYGAASSIWHRAGNLNEGWYNGGEWYKLYGSNTLIPQEQVDGLQEDLARLEEDLGSSKVSKSGDTMTDTLSMQHTGMEKGIVPSAEKGRYIRYVDKNSTPMGYHGYYQGLSSSYIQIRSYDAFELTNNKYATLSVGHDSNDSLPYARIAINGSSGLTASSNGSIRNIVIQDSSGTRVAAGSKIIMRRG